MKKIVFFGDSLTAGYGLSNPTKDSIPALIAAKLRGRDLPFQVINAGLSGDTSRSALSRLSGVLNGDIAVFVLELGANDFLRGHSPVELTANLQKIITEVRLFDPTCEILLLGIELPLWVNPAYGFGYAKIFGQLATNNQVALVPSFLKGVAGNRSLNMPDGVHPLAEGYRIAAANLWPSLLKMLTKD